MQTKTEIAAMWAARLNRMNADIKRMAALEAENPMMRGATTRATRYRDLFLSTVNEAIASANAEVIGQRLAA